MHGEEVLLRPLPNVPKKNHLFGPRPEASLGECTSMSSMKASDLNSISLQAQGQLNVIEIELMLPLQNFFRAMVSQREQQPPPAAPIGANSALFRGIAAARMNRDRSRSPVQRDAVLTKISDVKQLFFLPKHIVTSMSQQCGQDRVNEALKRLETGLLTTCFSGCGVPEIHIEAMAATHGVKVSLGSALDWDKRCQSVLRKRWPDRCCFGNIQDMVKGLKKTKGKKPPSCKALSETAWCYTHSQYCNPFRQQPAQKGGLKIHLAGPCCPPWSAFGRGDGTQDPRYDSHEAIMSSCCQVCF